MKIKVCGLCDPANIRAIAQLDPDYMGFIFYSSSPRYVVRHPEAKAEILSLSQVKKVGVFVNAEVDEISRRVGEYQLDIVQLHGDEPPGFCEQVARIKPVIKAFQVTPDADFSALIAYEGACQHFLLDTASQQYGGTGKTFNWGLLQEYKLDKPFLLSGGIGPDHAAAIKKLSHPTLYGIDINSRFETSPGIKNIEQVKSFFYEIRNR